jgi:hypothetical protein
MNTVWDRRASTTFAIRKFDDDRLCGGVLRRRGRTSRLQPAFHLSMVDQPGLLRYRTTAVEDDKVRYAANIETGRELRIALGTARSSCRFAPEAFQFSLYIFSQIYLAKFRFAQLVDRRHRRHISFIVSASLCNYR